MGVRMNGMEGGSDKWKGKMRQNNKQRMEEEKGREEEEKRGEEKKCKGKEDKKDRKIK